MFRAVFLFFLGFAVFLPAGFSDPSLEVVLTPSEISLDEKASLKLEISWPKTEGAYSFGIPDPELELLSLTNQSEAQESFVKNGEEWTRKTFILELTPTQPGQGTLRGFSITYLNPSLGSAPGAFHVSPLSLKIKPSSAKSRLKSMMLLAGLGLAFVIAATLGASIYLLRNQHPLSKDKAAPASLTPEEAAIGELKKALDSLSNSSNAAYDLSRYFKSFLSRFYHIPAEKNSEAEILAAVSSRDLPKEEFVKIQSILERLKEAKFMGGSLDPLDVQSLKSDISNFVESKRVIETS